MGKYRTFVDPSIEEMDSQAELVKAPFQEREKEGVFSSVIGRDSKVDIDATKRGHREPRIVEDGSAGRDDQIGSPGEDSLPGGGEIEFMGIEDHFGGSLTKGVGKWEMLLNAEIPTMNDVSEKSAPKHASESRENRALGLIPFGLREVGRVPIRHEPPGSRIDIEETVHRIEGRGCVARDHEE